eukprot:m.127724 g.127724  ORF g.127724 m.127724 type:complete len:200 (-) comp52270_c0_seq3:223-822(-)
MAADFSSVVWSICVCIYVILLITSYATPNWVDVNTPENSTDQYSAMGPVVVCTYDHVALTSSCGRWGSSFFDWPTRTWRAALIFDVIALALACCVFIFSFFTCFCCKQLFTLSKLFLVLSQILVLVGILAFMGGLKDINEPETQLNTCTKAEAFKPGEGCSFSWSGIVAVIALLWGFVPTLWSFCLTPSEDYEDDGSLA